MDSRLSGSYGSRNLGNDAPQNVNGANGAPGGSSAGASRQDRSQFAAHIPRSTSTGGGQQPGLTAGQFHSIANVHATQTMAMGSGSEHLPPPPTGNPTYVAKSGSHVAGVPERTSVPYSRVTAERKGGNDVSAYKGHLDPNQ